MNRILKRQLKKIFHYEFDNDEDIKLLTDTEQKLITFFNETYNEMMKDRRHIEHTLEMSLLELKEANKYIKSKNEDVQNLLEQYKTAIDSTLIVSKTDLNGIITYVNQKFIDISGYAEKELIGKSHNIVRHPDNDPSIFKDLWSTITKKQIWQKTLANKKKNGETYYVSATIIPILNKNGDAIEYMGIREDITEMIIHQQNLEKAREKAEKAEKAKSEFLANMSHEIRTPMNGIFGFIQILNSTNLTDKQKKYTSIIENSTKTLLDIINDILDFSKIESGKIEIEKIECNIFKDLEDSLLLLMQKAKDKNLVFAINIDPKINECIFMDIVKIKQILLNLIGNAIKFTQSGGEIKLQIDLVKDEKNTSLLKFSVKDTGIGIPLDRQDKIFQPFSQADSSTTRKFGGTGLGLSISNSLVKVLDGNLSLISEENAGSEFFFTIKVEKCLNKDQISKILNEVNICLLNINTENKNKILKQLNSFHIKYKEINESDLVQDNINCNIVITTEEFNMDLLDKTEKIILISPYEAKMQNDKIFQIYNLNEFPSLLYNILISVQTNTINTNILENYSKSLDMKVLLVEDYEINRDLMEEIFKIIQIDYDIAVNGLEAVEKATKNHYDLILMDINMPIMNGVEATKEIRKKGLRLPIIALTANALKGDKERFLADGMDDYLSKPVDIEQLKIIFEKFKKSR